MRKVPVELVVDTSALLAVLLDEPERAALIALTQGATLLAPGSVPWEVGNGLIAGFRRKRLSARQVRDAWSYFERIPLRLLEVTVPKALGLAEQLGLYAYDAYIIEAARAQRVPLLAMDGRLRTAAAELGLEVWEVTS
ncbi:MAG TPA: type II toxin-antitoxin system VapC family toxin [Anaerolineales bacterium]|nr:type II toxin-antitoxin system VapC family toxin [Anaerolineales bacterium]